MTKQFDSTWKRHKASQCTVTCWYCTDEKEGGKSGSNWKKLFMPGKYKNTGKYNGRKF